MEESKGSSRSMLLYVGIAAVVIVAIGYLLYQGVGSTSAAVGQPVSPQELAALNRLANNQTLAAQISTSAYAGVNSSLYFQKIDKATLEYGGKPEVLYIGADFCPYCAATRWPLVIALMRFGNMSGISYMQSSPTDVFPNTATFSFYPNYSYSSKYLSFRAFETETRTSQPLQQLDNSSQSIYYQYGTAIPFMDFMNNTIVQGSLSSPGVYKGLSWTQITSELADPSSTVSQDVIGAANIYTAEICQDINNTASVCSQRYVTSIEHGFLT